MKEIEPVFFIRHTHDRIIHGEIPADAVRVIAIVVQAAMDEHPSLRFYRTKKHKWNSQIYGGIREFNSADFITLVFGSRGHDRHPGAEFLYLHLYGTPSGAWRDAAARKLLSQEEAEKIAASSRNRTYPVQHVTDEAVAIARRYIDRELLLNGAKPTSSP